MGGLPWWLLKHDDIALRTRDPKFMEPATRYLKELTRVLGPLQITKGGPILMFQVENEYGSFGSDVEYMGELRQALIDGGIDVPLFACNPTQAVGKDYRADLFQVVNFQPGAAKSAFERLRKFQKTGPLMNGEFYPAWFDTWGSAHRTSDVGKFIDDLHYMLKNRQSFSIYMAHGGTSFGLWAGADRPFNSDTSSYDYDAPISEAGWASPGKFSAIRDLFAKYLLPGETLPVVPAPNLVIEIAPFALRESAPILENLPPPKKDETPRTMELYDQGRGCILYRSTVPSGVAGKLTIGSVHDFAWVFLDGKPLGSMDRRTRQFSVILPAREKASRLDIFVEAMGRINFGTEIFDRKGIVAPVKLDGRELRGWEVFSLPLDESELAKLNYQTEPPKGPAFWRGSFDLAKTGDTFLNVRSWGKGVVWINGHCMGRFWNIGPTQTMYVPGPWLKTGRNEVVVLDLLGPAKPELMGQKTPILDELRPKLDFSSAGKATGTFSDLGQPPVAEGEFKAGDEWQEVKFSHSAEGRYLCLEALSSVNGQPRVAVAELDAVSPGGEILSKALWKILWVSSQELDSESGEASNALDGQTSTAWSTQHKKKGARLPACLVIDMGETKTLGGIRYLPRAGKPTDPGLIKGYKVHLSPNPFGLTVSE